MRVPAKLDAIYPRFIWNICRFGLAGLAIAAILQRLSELSAALKLDIAAARMAAIARPPGRPADVPR